MGTRLVTVGLLSVAALGTAVEAHALEVVDGTDLAEICRRTEVPSRALPIPWLQPPECSRADHGVEADPPDWDVLPDSVPGFAAAAEGEHSQIDTAPEACLDASRSVQAISAHRFAVERAALLLQSHRASIPSSAFALMPYDEQTELLAISVSDDFELFGGAWVLDVVDDQPLEFALSPADAADVEQRWALDALVLELTFELPWSTDWSGDYCYHAPTGASALRIHPLRAALVDALTGQVLVRSRTQFDVAAGMRHDEGSSEPPQPGVQVTSLEVISGGANEDLDFEMMRVAIEFGLLECYLRGLSTNARLQGAMVFVLDAGALESDEPPVVSIDALGSDVVHGCAVDALSRLPWPSVCGRMPPADTQLRATVVFDR